VTLGKNFAHGKDGFAECQALGKISRTSNGGQPP
jgi:hypothetical protein